MKIVFTIDVGINVENYEEAGKILDQATKSLSEVLGEKGRYDVGQFQARHRPVVDYDEPQAMLAEGPRDEAPERIR